MIRIDLKMIPPEILLVIYLMATFGLAGGVGRWARLRVDNNTVRFFVELCGILLWVFMSYCVAEACADNDHHDHGGNTSNDHVVVSDDDGNSSDDHVIVTIKELAVVNPSVLLRSIPVVDFNSRNFEDVIECVVCLSELADGDKTKLLPSCEHWFHAHCIDMWLQLHATCPICRERVCLFQSNKPSSQLSSPVEPPAATIQEANSGNPADITSVVVDIPTIPEIGEIGPITSLSPL